MTITGRVINYLNKIITIDLDKHYVFRENQPIEVKFRAKDCNQELRGLLWLLIEFLADQLGYQKMEMYCILKDEGGLFEEVRKPDGKIIRIYQSTANSEIDDSNLSQFYRFCELWAVDNGLNIEKFVLRHNAIRAMRGKEPI